MNRWEEYEDANDSHLAVCIERMPKRPKDQETKRPKDQKTKKGESLAPGGQNFLRHKDTKIKRQRQRHKRRKHKDKKTRNITFVEDVGYG